MAQPLRIAPGKRAYAATLEDACRDLGITDDARADRFGELARQCTLNANTLLSNLAVEGPPEPETLRKLRDGTGIPITTWYVRLGIIDAEDIGHALAYDEPPRVAHGAAAARPRSGRRTARRGGLPLPGLLGADARPG